MPARLAVLVLVLLPAAAWAATAVDHGSVDSAAELVLQGDRSEVTLRMIDGLVRRAAPARSAIGLRTFLPDRRRPLLSCLRPAPDAVGFLLSLMQSGEAKLAAVVMIVMDAGMLSRHAVTLLSGLFTATAPDAVSYAALYSGVLARLSATGLPAATDFYALVLRRFVDRIWSSALLFDTVRDGLGPVWRQLLALSRPEIVEVLLMAVRHLNSEELWARLMYDAVVYVWDSPESTLASDPPAWFRHRRIPPTYLAAFLALFIQRAFGDECGLLVALCERNFTEQIDLGDRPEVSRRILFAAQSGLWGPQRIAELDLALIVGMLPPELAWKLYALGVDLALVYRDQPLHDYHRRLGELFFELLGRRDRLDGPSVRDNTPLVVISVAIWHNDARASASAPAIAAPDPCAADPIPYHTDVVVRLLGALDVTEPEQSRTFHLLVFAMQTWSRPVWDSPRILDAIVAHPLLIPLAWKLLYCSLGACGPHCHGGWRRVAPDVLARSPAGTLAADASDRDRALLALLADVHLRVRMRTAIWKEVHVPFRELLDGFLKDVDCFLCLYPLLMGLSADTAAADSAILQAESASDSVPKAAAPLGGLHYVEVEGRAAELTALQADAGGDQPTGNPEKVPLARMLCKHRHYAHVHCAADMEDRFGFCPVCKEKLPPSQ